MAQTKQNPTPARVLYGFWIMAFHVHGGDNGVHLGAAGSGSSDTSNAAPVQQAAPASLIRKDLGSNNNFGYVGGNFPG